jgi:ATP-dependent Clp protease adaptor protein ClpS
MSKQNQPGCNPKGGEMLEMNGEKNNFLILYNDEINSFDYVIESLMEVCQHDTVQAEQCTYIAHYKGKCDVKKGTVDLLNPMHIELARRGITTTID